MSYNPTHVVGDENPSLTTKAYLVRRRDEAEVDQLSGDPVPPVAHHRGAVVGSELLLDLQYRSMRAKFSSRGTVSTGGKRQQQFHLDSTEVKRFKLVGARATLARNAFLAETLIDSAAK